MSFLNKLKSMTSKASSEIADQFNRVKNKDVMEAVVASCTYVAYADGRITSEEKNKMLGFLQHTECLRMYKTDDVIETFGKFTRKFEFDQDIGKSEVFNALAKVKEHNEKELVVRACVIIANSDGNFDQSEKKAVEEICGKFGLSASQFT
jgi:tellurite resistance protein TerB